MSTLIKNGRVITASDDYVADVFFEGEVVAAIGNHLKVNPNKVIDMSKNSQSRIILPML
jgi:dihydropyrimidinase